jgi:hypothetical protein
MGRRGLEEWKNGKFVRLGIGVLELLRRGEERRKREACGYYGVWTWMCVRVGRPPRFNLPPGCQLGISQFKSCWGIECHAMPTPYAHFKLF